MTELSRTQKKKKDRELQKLGERLVGLSKDQLSQIPLSSELAEAVLDAKTMQQHGARRRQMQYIGVLMRSEDSQPILTALERIAQGTHEEVRRFKLIENFRNELVSGDDSLFEMLLEKHRSLDRKKLSSLVAQARKEKSGLSSSKAGRKLFRYLSEQIS